jgi:hypothetical protein
MRASFGESLRDHPFMTIEIMNNYSCSFPMHPNKKEIEWCEEVARPVVCQSSPKSYPQSRSSLRFQDIIKANAFPPVHKSKQQSRGYYKEWRMMLLMFIGRRPTS